ncbi:hypothetical protein KY289_035679 [Solanum tuberosum]|nr:hypothetical protein KY289_035679 [Solanum tuberosum]
MEESNRNRSFSSEVRDEQFSSDASMSRHEEEVPVIDDDNRRPPVPFPERNNVFHNAPYFQATDNEEAVRLARDDTCSYIVSRGLRPCFLFAFTNNLMDIPSPFYLDPFENAGSSLLPGVFDGAGYRSWRRVVLRALSVKSKTGFINGKIVKPNPDDPGFQQWERCDDMVTSWILNSFSPDLRDSLQYVNNAQNLWAELEERYDQTNGCKLYQLQKEINDLVQGTLDVTGYYTKMKKLWEEMSTVDVSSQCSCVCTCGGKTKLVKAE